MTTTPLQTFVVITGLMGCLMSLVIFFIRRSYLKAIPGLGEWSIFPVLTACASGLYALQGQVHHIVSMALPNLLVALALIAQAQGTFRYFSQAISSRLLFILVGMALVFIGWTSGKDAYYTHRLVFISGLATLTLTSQVKLLWARRSGSFAAKFMLLTLVTTAIVMLTRAITAALEPVPLGIYSYSPMQALYLASFAFGVLLLSICAILLSMEHLLGKMAELMRYDTLTGALTRKAWFDYGLSEIARCARLGSDLAVLMLDLDHFKNINDRYGHQIGDKVLVDFVKSTESVLRRPAAMGRYGGEEFVVLLPDTTCEEALRVAERIQNRLRTLDMQPSITVSIGLACYAGPQDTLETVIGRADEAMYTAKSNGRDRIELRAAQAGQ